MGKGKGTWASKGVSPWQMVAHLQLRYQGLLTEQWSLRCYSATLRLLLSRNVALILLALNKFLRSQNSFMYMTSCLSVCSLTQLQTKAKPVGQTGYLWQTSLRPLLWGFSITFYLSRPLHGLYSCTTHDLFGPGVRVLPIFASPALTFI